EEIARAYLASEATVAQRIVRAKRTLAQAQVPFEVPRGSELAERLSSVLEGGAAPRPDPRDSGAGRARGPRPRGARRDPGLAHCRARGPARRAGAAARPGPRGVGAATD